MRDEAEQLAHKQASSSVLKALDVIEALVAGGSPATLGELAAVLRRPAPSVHRLLRTLQLRGWVESEAGRYRLSLKVFEVGMSVVERMDLISESRDPCSRLRDEFNETVNVAIRSGASMVYVGKYERQPPMRLVSHLGLHVPIYCTAMGKAVLAAMTERERGSILARLDFEARTDKTITRLSDLLSDLEVSSRRGWAVDNEEFEQGLTCIGAAVTNHSGEIVGGISLTSPTHRMPASIWAQRGDRVRGIAADISWRLGHRPEMSDPQRRIWA